MIKRVTMITDAITVAEPRPLNQAARWRRPS
jgi:hypothetical protein